MYLYNNMICSFGESEDSKAIFSNQLSNGWRYHFGLLLFTSSNGWGSGAAKLAAFFSKKPRLSSPGAGAPDVWNEMWPKTLKHGYTCNKQVSLDFWKWHTRWWITMNYMWTCGTGGWGASHIADHIAISCLDRQMSTHPESPKGLERSQPHSPLAWRHCFSRGEITLHPCWRAYNAIP